MVAVPLEGCGDPVVLDSCGEAARQRAQGPAGASAAAGCGSSIVLSDAAALAVAALTSGSLRPRSAQRESRRTGRRSVSAGHGRECRGREGMPTAQTHPARPSSSRKFENCCQSASHRTRVHAGAPLTHRAGKACGRGRLGILPTHQNEGAHAKTGRPRASRRCPPACRRDHKIAG